MNQPDDLIDILNAYAHGLFPMAEARHSEGFGWYRSVIRSLLPIEHLHISRSLKRQLTAHPFDIRVDRDFHGVITACAAPRRGEAATWINDDIIAMMVRLHEAGFAHSVECWRDGALVGGIYGTALGGLFCGESMFSRKSNASKIALAHLCARLWHGGFRLFDTQFINPHVAQFGAYEMPHEEYMKILPEALRTPALFHTDMPEGELLRLYMDYRRDHQ